MTPALIYLFSLIEALEFNPPKLTIYYHISYVDWTSKPGIIICLLLKSMRPASLILARCYIGLMNFSSIILDKEEITLLGGQEERGYVVTW